MKEIFHCAAVLLLLASFNAQLSTLFAQGTAFTYQGQLQNSGGPVNGSYDLTFSLYTTSINGTAIAGPVTNSAVPVTNGLFTTLVDFVPDVFTGTSNWLAIAVRTNGAGSFTSLSPRQQVTPTPYALYSANAALAASASSVPAADVSGTLGLGQLPAAVITNNDTGANLTGTFTGNGASLTNIPLTGLASAGSLGLTTNGYGYILAATLGVGSLPYVVTAATNLSGAGYVDLVAPNFGDGTLTVLTNNGTGGFTTAATPTVGISSYPVSVAVMDVNNDGKPDLICADYGTNTLTVLTNRGEARFGSNATLVVGLKPFTVIAADMNGDGKLDLISANYGTNTLTVLTNNGNGKFGFYATVVVGLNPAGLVSADVNKDGKPDLICANVNSNTVTVLINNGNGTFLPATYPVGFAPITVVAVDVNGDGWVDLVCGNDGSGTLTVLTNNQNGTFTLASTVMGVGGQPYSLAVADVNGDGRPDLICANLTGSLQVVLNTGNGTFALGPVLSPSGASELVGVTAVDVNGDGKTDLVAPDNFNSQVFELLNDTGAPSTELTLAGQSGGLSLSPGLNGVPNLIGGSSANVVGSSVTGSVIAGGGSAGAINAIFADYSSISGGAGNTIETSSDYSSIGGGWDNIISGPGAFIGGGGYDGNYFAGNFAGGAVSVIGGGLGNTNNGYAATVPGGFYNLANGDYSTVAGGYGNTANGDYSFAAGNQATANHQGSFVWADSQGATFKDTGNDEFLIRAQGGVGINTASPQKDLSVNGEETVDRAGTNSGAGPDLYFGNGAEGIGSVRASGYADQSGLNFYTSGNKRITILQNGDVGIGTTNTSHLLTVGNGSPQAYCDGTTWVNGSDRNSKENFLNLDPREVLAKVSALPITEWQYKVEAGGTKHIGPMAQDFHAAFGLNGADDKHISTVDEGGVALAAIQGLNQKLEQQGKDKDAEIQQLKAKADKVDALEKQLNDLEAMVKTLAEKK
jgi:hypothetical protein